MTLFQRLVFPLAAVALALVAQPAERAQANDERFIIVQSTTSTEAASISVMNLSILVMNQLYAVCTGIAMQRPASVVINASEMPFATTLALT